MCANDVPSPDIIQTLGLCCIFFYALKFISVAYCLVEEAVFAVEHSLFAYHTEPFDHSRLDTGRTENHGTVMF